MQTAHKLLPLLLLAATLHTAHAQQTPSSDQTTKTKVKTKRATSAASAVVPAPEGAPAPFPGGPRGPQGPAGPNGPRAGRGPHHPGGPQGRPQALREVKTYSGTLSSYTTNPEGLYDGFLVNLNGTATRVHFPPHMAKALMAATKPGQTVHFEAVAGPAFSLPTATAATAAAAAPRLELVSVGEGTTALQLTPPVRPEATAATTATATTVSGTIAQLRTDERGQLRGLVLADNTLLLVPPHVGEQLADKLKVGTSIQATALAVPATEGVVAADALRRLRTQTLTINGTRFLVN
ncbi:hypothetical protein [Hymenobacter perfusus]|uniref:DUF5666 domain-containing protein n=1 Tax=Hymenobacter perfusus TaxID=1236770 RepID=A0A3R9NYT2_9BACT|nr:hypothetical protein [Hymenobacter perfusus]RSK46484.1 hypothetical protein EI293_04790 [Hymenobacter perfusus]